MRVSSLSNPQVIALLQQYFVPVYVGRDESRQIQPSPEDQRELRRVGDECRKCGLEAGSVCVYVIPPDGAMLATQVVQKASKPEQLVPSLQQIIEKERVQARPSEAKPAPAAPPKAVRSRTE